MRARLITIPRRLWSTIADTGPEVGQIVRMGAWLLHVYDVDATTGYVVFALAVDLSAWVGDNDHRHESETSS